MSSAQNRKPPGGESLTEAMQDGLSTWMAIPQRLMQANIEAMNQGMTILNRRMKAQAELWSGLGQLGKGASPAEAQKAFVDTITRDMAEEVNQMSELAKKNFAIFSDLAAKSNRGMPGAQSS